MDDLARALLGAKTAARAKVIINDSAVVFHTNCRGRTVFLANATTDAAHLAVAARRLSVVKTAAIDHD